MKIILNNREEEIGLQEMNVNDLIAYKNFSFKLLVTKINGRLIKRTERNEAFIREGDKVEILHLISGG